MKEAEAIQQSYLREGQVNVFLGNRGESQTSPPSFSYPNLEVYTSPINR